MSNRSELANAYGRRVSKTLDRALLESLSHTLGSGLTESNRRKLSNELPEKLSGTHRAGIMEGIGAKHIPGLQGAISELLWFGCRTLPRIRRRDRQSCESIDNGEDGQPIACLSDVSKLPSSGSNLAMQALTPSSLANSLIL